ncbi:MAG: hypothetical protein VYB88_03400 [Pseudomonadota bacterium]|uniref:hypothetical protein n=1 Tax=Ralstonia pickettii TaxID=329 RepID=UPI002714A1F3|nr:hypothetical protein [Ralstonia pickettii]MEE2976495.1 hypothetical protein [Pseudomonadota bacterium]WKZ86383.1 hypothetical protein N5B55_05355 [Ralstonia pickettii]
MSTEPKALKGALCISRPSRSNGEDVIKLELKDSNSGQRFLAIEMTPADFAMAVTGLSYVPVEFVLRGRENVGLIKQTMPGRLVLPREKRSYCKEELRQMLHDRCQKEGWILNDYIGAQNSVTTSEDGGYTINFSYYRFVEEELHAE